MCCAANVERIAEESDMKFSQSLPHKSTPLSVFAVALVALGAISLSTSAVRADGDNSAGPSLVGSSGAGMNAPLGPGDTLRIDVVGQPDLSRQYQVDADGDIEMMYVGKVHVAGLSTDQATSLITDALGKIYVSPQVTVTRASMGGDSVTVTGSVTKQGTAVVRRDAHLNEVIQQAVPTADADLTKVEITRGLPGQEHSNLTIDLAGFLSNGVGSDNPALQDGDVIFVPSQTPVSLSVSIVGAVVKPGRFDVQPGATVYDLVKLAGGLEDSADRTSIYVQPIGTMTHNSFDYDKARQAPEDATLNPVLSDGDKVVVPEVTTIPVFSITGAVVKPGQYPINTRLSLTDAEGLAGGLLDRAKVDQIVVTRDMPQGAKVIKLNTTDPQVPADFMLQPGDNVYIPQGHPGYHIDPLSGILAAVGVYGVVH
jgi:polysaccharide export outer membrane protein